MNEEQKKYFLILTLGCKLNQLESEAVSDALSRAGFELLTETNAESPSLIIINTCTVTSKADQKARRVIRKALRDYPYTCVVVTGCYAQLNKDDILALDTDAQNRLFVINKKEILDLPEYLFKSEIKNRKSEHLSFQLTAFKPSEPAPDSRLLTPNFQFNPKHFSNHTRSFLKIHDGCGKHCTYCKIRLARGPSISLDANEVLSRLRMLEQNHAEAVLAGVNISQYVDFGFFINEQSRTEEDKVFGLTELLDYLLSGTEKIAIRLSSLAPESVDEKFANVLAHERIRPHFHLSVQSCSDKVLEKMGRDYTGQTVEKAAALLRSAKSDPFLACDIITGFPGETQSEFEQTYSMCKKIGFAWIHVFPYSKRQGTPAFLFKENITESEITKRVELFTDLAKQGRVDYVRRWLGREVDVLIENRERGKAYCLGVSENYLKTLVRHKREKKPSPGTVLRCKLIEEGDFLDFDVAAEEVLV